MTVSWPNWRVRQDDYCGASRPARSPNRGSRGPKREFGSCPRSLPDLSVPDLSPISLTSASSSIYRLRDDISSHHLFTFPVSVPPRVVKLFLKNNFLRLPMIPNGFGPELALNVLLEGTSAIAGDQNRKFPFGFLVRTVQEEGRPPSARQLRMPAGDPSPALVDRT